MPEWILETYYILLPIIFTGFMTWVGTAMKKSQKKAEELERQRREDMEEAQRRRDANSEGTKLILFYMLQRLHTEYMYQQYITHEQRNQYKDIYDAYHVLGGNGFGTAMWEEVKELPIRNDKSSVSPFIRILKGELPEKKESD